MGFWRVTLGSWHGRGLAHRRMFRRAKLQSCYIRRLGFRRHVLSMTKVWGIGHKKAFLWHLTLPSIHAWGLGFRLHSFPMLHDRGLAHCLKFRHAMLQSVLLMGVQDCSDSSTWKAGTTLLVPCIALCCLTFKCCGTVSCCDQQHQIMSGLISFLFLIKPIMLFHVSHTFASVCVL